MPKKKRQEITQLAPAGKHVKLLIRLRLKIKKHINLFPHMTNNSVLISEII